MATAIGVVMTSYIVAGRLENLRLAGKPLRYPNDHEEHDALTAVPASELAEMLAEHIAKLVNEQAGTIDAIGVAVPGIVRSGVVEDSPNLPQIKGMRMAEESDARAPGAADHYAGVRGQRR